MKKFTIGIIASLALLIGVGVHAQTPYPLSKTLVVSNIMSQSATVQITGGTTYGATSVIIEYQYDTCATNLRQHGSNVCPAVYVMPQTVTITEGQPFTLTQLIPNSVYNVRYVIAYGDTLEAGPWTSFATTGQDVIQYPVVATLDLGPTTIRQGSTGQYVMNLQILLNTYLNAGLTPDGKFGLRTKTAVMAFQASKNLYPDGAVGAITKQALYSLQGYPSLPPNPTPVTPIPATTVQVSNSDNGKTVTIGNGQLLSITLGNPGDSGYQYDTPLYDQTILRFISKTTTPNTTGSIGNWGTITWNFVAQKQGSTSVNFTMSRPWEGGEKNVQAFRVQALVK